PVSKSHNLGVLTDATIHFASLSMAARQCCPFSPAGYTRFSLPEATSHKRAVPSKLAVTSFLVSLLRATAVIMSACPLNVRIGFPVLKSHKRTAPSQLPVTSHWPSLLRAIA